MTQYFALAILISAVLMFALRAFLIRRGKNYSLLFYAGLAHILIGLPLLFSLTLVIGAGCIAAGVLLLLVSRARLALPLQAAAAVLPAALFGAYLWYASASANLFLIPEGYTGRVLIVHGCEEGIEKEFEGMRRVYRIPASGILKTQFTFAGDSFDNLNSKFYYVDAKGNRTALQTDEARPKTGIVAQGVWTLPHEQAGDTIIDFIVEEGTLDDPRSYAMDEQPRLQEAIESCRQ